MEDILPELLITDLIGETEINNYLSLNSQFKSAPVDQVKNESVFMKQKLLDFFVDDFHKINNLFKMPAEPIFFQTDFRSRQNIVDVPMSACYLELLLFDSNVTLVRYRP
jgi:hypothetical protein